ncbi:disulfide bond formation protein DsbB [Marinospirillum alkaliphilum DSM 21637]|uniref:Disulfide bond formation protein DsbB n=2 Tax=Marinospirillum TaxID=64968 RepID=A0A1K1Y381_9GAMM|nr:disulfide bond formation protein DsbB [Marinospirillum alkaliphilum DSM 21637]
MVLFQRHGLLLTLIGSLVIVAAAFAYEKITGLLPCHLCWLQRWVFIGFAALSLCGLALQRFRLVRWLLALVFALLILVGSGIALRHLYIKLNPQTVSCGMDVQTLLDFFPLWEAVSHMLIGSSDCAQAADFLGLPLPTWSLTGYLLLGSLAIYSLLSRKTQ